MKPVEIEILMKDGLSGGIRKAGNEVSGLEGKLQGLKHTVIGAFAADKLVSFGRKIMDVRSEVESLQISFETLAGTMKGRELFGDIRNFAVTTPMQMQDLAKGAQTLLGFNIEAEKVMPILKQIGDISMGDAQKFNSLTLAFAQMSSTGKLMGQDLLQMINAGFNPLQEIANKTGKSISKLKDEMSKGKITVKMVEDAFASATGEGGKFHGMLEKQSEGLKGALSNLEGAWTDALNEMGEKGEGVMVDVVKFATSAVQNLDKLGTVILTVAASWGEYKATLMAVEALQNVIASQKESIESTRVSELESLASNYRSSLASDALDSESASLSANTSAKESNQRATEDLTVANNDSKRVLEERGSLVDQEIRKIESELEANLKSAEAKYSSAEADEAVANAMVDTASRRVASAQEILASAEAEGNAVAVASAKEELATAVKEKNTAGELRNTASKELSIAGTEKQVAAQQLSTFQTEVDTVQKGANTAATGLWAAVTNTATAAFESLKAAMATNPFGVILVAITTVIGLFSLFTSKTKESTSAVQKFREAVGKEQSQLNQFIAVLNNTTKGSKAYNEALGGINTMARDYNTTQLEINDTLEEQTEKYEELRDAMRRHTAEKLLIEASSKADEDAMKSEKEAMDDLIESAADFEYVKDVIKAQMVQGASTQIKAEAENIQAITTATWGAISTEVMSCAQKIADAFKQSDSEGKKALDDLQERIEKILLSADVTEAELESFGTTLRVYLNTASEGFRKAYGELERTESQLAGLSDSTIELKDITNESISQMNYEELEQALINVKNRISDINSGKLKINTSEAQTELLRLEEMVLRIMGLMSVTITKGSETELTARLNAAKAKRSAAEPGSAEWHAANREVGQLDAQIKKIQSSYSENVRKDIAKAQQAAQREASRAAAQAKRDEAARAREAARQRTQAQRDHRDALRNAQDQADYELLIDRQSRELLRQAEDAEFEARELEIELEKSGTEKVLAQLKLDFDRKKKEIERGYEDLKIARIEKAKESFEANPANKGKVFDPGSVDSNYTAVETQNYERALELAEKEYNQKVAAAKRESSQDRLDYEKEYGNWLEKKRAISEEYALKIASAESEWERKRLEAERASKLREESNALTGYLLLYGEYEEKKEALRKDYAEKVRNATTLGERQSLQAELESKLAELDMSKLKEDVDWSSVFGGLDKLSQEHLERLKKQLYDSLRIGDIGAEDAKTIIDRIREIDDELDSRGNIWARAFGLVIPELEEIRRLEEESASAQERLSIAEEKRAEALREEAQLKQEIKEELNKNGLSVEGEITSLSLGTLLTSVSEDLSNKKDLNPLLEMFDKLGAAERKVTKSTEQLTGAQAEAGTAAEAAGGSFASTVAIIDAIVHRINDNVQSANELFEQMGLDDTSFGKGFSAFAESSKYATEAWESLKSGNIMGVANGVYGSLRTLGNALGEFGIGGFGDSDTSLLADIERLTESNKDLERAISNLADELQESKMSDATALYESQKADIEKEASQTQELMRRSGSAHSNGFLGIGGHHSSNKKINKGMSQSEWTAISQLLGKEVRSASDVWSLSSKEMWEIATHLTAEYTHLKDLANDGYRDAGQFMDEYIELWRKLEEIENAYREKMTGLSFDTLRSSFRDLVDEVKTGRKEILENVDEMLGDSIMHWLEDEKYNEKLEAWYAQLASSMEDGLSKSESENLRDWYAQIVEEMQSDRAQAFSTAGIDPNQSGVSQSGKAGGFETMSQDQGTKLEGLFVSGQIHWASIDDKLTDVSLELGHAGETLRRIEEHTGSSASSLAKIWEELTILKRDGLKVR